MTTFTAEVFQNEYLPSGADTVDAVVTVRSAEGGAVTESNAIQIIVIDTSGSMQEANGRILHSAKAATQAAISTIRDGVKFAVIGGNHQAYSIYPPQGLAHADDMSRQQAAAAVNGVRADGGTAMGTWLKAAAELAQADRSAICHTLLLTDGRNEHESPLEFDNAIRSCVGLMQCDARGLGAAWNVDELRKVSSALLGTADIIPSPDDMVAEFTKLMEKSMGKQVGDVALRLWAPKGSIVDFIKQVSPELQDLTGSARSVNPLTNDYPLGAWADAEDRDYHVRVRVPVGNVGDERLASRIMLVIDGVEQPAALVRAVWTDDTQLSTRINREVAHYTGQAELADMIAEGLAARGAGDQKQATVKLGRAVQIAHEAGNSDTVRLLQKVVDVDDAKSGTVRLKAQVEKSDEMALDVRSTKTVRVKKG